LSNEEQVGACLAPFKIALFQQIGRTSGQHPILNYLIAQFQGHDASVSHLADELDSAGYGSIRGDGVHASHTEEMEETCAAIPKTITGVVPDFRINSVETIDQFFQHRHGDSPESWALARLVIPGDTTSPREREYPQGLETDSRRAGVLAD